MGKRVLKCIAALGCIGLLSACGIALGTPDREESFSVQGGECTARWWLEPLEDEVPDEASEIARQALSSLGLSCGSGWRGVA